MWLELRLVFWVGYALAQAARPDPFLPGWFTFLAFMACACLFETAHAIGGEK